MRFRIKKSYIIIVLLLLFVHSGLIKWMQWPADPTLIFFGLVLLTLPFASFPKSSLDKNTLIVIITAGLFFVFLTLSALYSVSKEYWQAKLIHVLPHFATFLLPFVIIRTEDDFRALRRTYVAFTIVALTLMYWNYFEDGLRIILISEDGPFVEPTRYPDYLSISFFLATSILLLHTKMRFFEYLISFLSFLMIVILGGRGPLLFITICLIIYNWGKVSKRQLILSLVTFTIIGIVFVNTKYFDRSAARFSSLFEFSQDKSASERVTLLKRSFEIIGGNPILGVGVGGFSTAVNNTDERLSPHNIFLEVITETGILGLTIFLAFVLGAGIVVWKYQPRSEYQKVLKFICLFYFLELLISSILEDLRIPFFWLGVTLSLFSNKISKDVWN